MTTDWARVERERMAEAARATFPDQTCPACRLEHPGTDCQQPDLFGGES